MHTLFVGGGRSTKTFFIIRMLVGRAIRHPGSRHLIVRFRFNHVKSSIMLDTFPKVMKLCFPRVGYSLNKTDGLAVLPNGSEIWFGGLDDKERADKILGQEYATIFANECSQIPYTSILILRTRLAQNVPGLKLRAFYDLNPVGTMHWTNREFGELRDPLSRTLLKDPENYKRMFMNPVDNPWLPPETLRMYENLPGRYRKRFYEGLYVNEIDNALWTIERLEQSRIEPADVPADLARVVVAIDPSGTKGKDENKRSNQVGITVQALDKKGVGYLLRDLTTDKGPGGKLDPTLPPELQPGWGAIAVKAYQDYKADRIIAETNYGGGMVRGVVEAVDPTVAFREVTASRGKEVRAEPISALYEKGLVVHAGRFDALEEQLVNFSTLGYQGEGSPDRADALVWGFTDLMVDVLAESGIGMPIQVRD